MFYKKDKGSFRAFIFYTLNTLKKDKVCTFKKAYNHAG